MQSECRAGSRCLGRVPSSDLGGSWGGGCSRFLGRSGLHSCAAGWSRALQRLPCPGRLGGGSGPPVTPGSPLPHPRSPAWTSPVSSALIKQFVSDVAWGPLDYLVVDTPPGTSDEHMAAVDALRPYGPLGALVVTTPQVLRERPPASPAARHPGAGPVSIFPPLVAAFWGCPAAGLVCARSPGRVCGGRETGADLL